MKIKEQRQNLISEEQKRKESITTKAKVHELGTRFAKTNCYSLQPAGFQNKRTKTVISKGVLRNVSLNYF
jgi:hypothetical protein